MITLEHLRDLPLFASFSDDELRDVAVKAADVRVHAGDTFVQEGEEPSFWVLLAGTLDITKRVGTGQVTLATRERGGFFGETPVLLGSDMFTNAHATSDCRLMRVEPFDLQGLTVANLPFRELILDAMRGRLADIGARATRSKAEAVAIVGQHWDLPTREARTLLARNRVRYEFLMIDDPQTIARFPEIAEHDGGPLVRLFDGRLLVRPTTRQLAEAVGLQTRPASDAYDAIVVGGGPAGLAAAVYGASEGLRTLLVEREATGGQAGTSSRIENYLGFPTGLSGDDLGTRALEQAKRLGAEVLVTRKVCGFDPIAKTVTLDEGVVLGARTIVLATGVAWRALAIDGIERLTGMGVYYGAARSEARSTVGKDVYLIGGGNSAGQAAMFFSNYARSVTILIRGASLASSMSDYLIKQLALQANIEIRPFCEVTKLHGALHLEAIDVTNRQTNLTEVRATDALFIFIGADAETDWLPEAIARDSRGYVLTGSNLTTWPLARDPFLLETSVPGVFAVGDVRHGSVKRVASAVGEGSMAIAFAHQYLATIAVS